jgi:hypothetical protein
MTRKTNANFLDYQENSLGTQENVADMANSQCLRSAQQNPSFITLYRPPESNGKRDDA